MSFKPRCGNCIDGLHEDCLIALEFGGHRGRGRPKDSKETGPRSWSVVPYPWRCGCACEYAQQTRCVKCQRVGVEVDYGSRCRDRSGCVEVEVGAP